MTNKILLDSVILIDHLNGVQIATDYIAKHCQQAAISVITRAEVLTGFTQKQTNEVGQLLNFFPTLDITSAIADSAAELRRIYRWKLPDAFQAALANLHDLKLVTRNTKDFNPKEHHFVTIPYHL
jgi:predicted nucleic acid-binding protein